MPVFECGPVEQQGDASSLPYRYRIPTTAFLSIDIVIGLHHHR
jgi:hypothetical protein